MQTTEVKVIFVGKIYNDVVDDQMYDFLMAIFRIEVERKFSLAKHKFGLGLLRIKRAITTKILCLIIEEVLDKSWNERFVK